MAYLQFIIDYFEKLPPSMVFLHGHRSAPLTVSCRPFLLESYHTHLMSILSTYGRPSYVHERHSQCMCCSLRQQLV